MPIFIGLATEIPDRSPATNKSKFGEIRDALLPKLLSREMRVGDAEQVVEKVG